MLRCAALSSLALVGVACGKPHQQIRHQSHRITRAQSQTSIKVANKVRVNINVAINYTLKTRLATAQPAIAAEWDYDRNPGHIYPKILGCGDITPYWWMCGECGSHFKMSTEKRVLRNGACETCSRLAKTKRENTTSREADSREPLVEDSLEGESRSLARHHQLSQEHAEKRNSLLQNEEKEEDVHGQLPGERSPSKATVIHSRKPIGKF